MESLDEQHENGRASVATFTDISKRDLGKGDAQRKTQPSLPSSQYLENSFLSLLQHLVCLTGLQSIIESLASVHRLGESSQNIAFILTSLQKATRGLI